MAQKNSPNLSLAYGWDYGEDGWDTGHNATIQKLDAMVQLSVISASTTASPGSPAEGDRYIVPAGGTGDFSGQAGKVGFYIGAAWVFYTPVDGVTAWVEDDKVHVVYDSSAWSAPKAPYDIGMTFGAVMANDEVILRYPMPRDVTYPAGLTGSLCIAAIAATAELILSVKKDAVEFGTITFAAAGTVATFAAASETSFAAGDILTIVAPASADATLADLGLALIGIR